MTLVWLLTTSNHEIKYGEMLGQMSLKFKFGVVWIKFSWAYICYGYAIKTDEI